MKDRKQIYRLDQLYARVLMAKEQQQQHIYTRTRMMREEVDATRTAFEAVDSAKREIASTASDVLQWHLYEAFLGEQLANQEQLMGNLELTLRDAIEQTKVAYQKSETWKILDEQVAVSAQRAKERREIGVNDELALNRRHLGADYEE